MDGWMDNRAEMENDNDAQETREAYSTHEASIRNR
jgi:hypothetical protein